MTSFFVFAIYSLCLSALVPLSVSFFMSYFNSNEQLSSHGFPSEIL
jgi:hypothetical protein